MEADISPTSAISFNDLMRKGASTESPGGGWRP